MDMIKKAALPVLLLVATVFGTLYAQTTSDRVEGVWFNDKKDAKIQIYKGNDGKFYGKIIWLKEPLENGRAKMDKNNPKDNMKKQPLVGLVILKGFEKDGSTSYDDGTIYDPENGKTYDCTMTYKGTNLSIRGYIGISLFGRTTVWERTN